MLISDHLRFFYVKFRSFKPILRILIYKGPKQVSSQKKETGKIIQYVVKVKLPGNFGKFRESEVTNQVQLRYLSIYL